MEEQRWVPTRKLCNGYASYNGPCGDPYCSDCYPGGEVCTQCDELRGCCECDRCENCGENWQEEYGQYCICPFCSCAFCGETESSCDCEDGFEKEEPEKEYDFERRMIKLREVLRKKRGPTSVIKIDNEFYIAKEKHGSIGRKGT